MNPYPNPLIRIIIDDEDGELPSIDISHHHNDDDDEDDDEDEDDRHQETGHYDETVSETSSVDSFIRQLDSLHPFRLYINSVPLLVCASIDLFCNHRNNNKSKTRGPLSGEIERLSVWLLLLIETRTNSEG